MLEGWVICGAATAVSMDIIGDNLYLPFKNIKYALLSFSYRGRRRRHIFISLGNKVGRGCAERASRGNFLHVEVSHAAFTVQYNSFAMQPQKRFAGRISGRHIIDRIGVGGGLHNRTALLGFRISPRIRSEYLLIEYEIGGSCELHFLIVIRIVSLKLFKNNLKCTYSVPKPLHFLD